jgi:beta-aspartyl-peptidase (threonine type)
VLFVSAFAFGGWLALPTRGGPPETISPKDRASIEGVIATQQKDWNEGNVDAFLRGYWHSEELTFSGSQGISRGWDGVRERYNKSYPDRPSMGKLDFSSLEFRGLGPNAALVLGQWHLTREKGDVGGVFSLVFQRVPEGWKIIHDHTRVIPPSIPR